MEYDKAEHMRNIVLLDVVFGEVFSNSSMYSQDFLDDMMLYESTLDFWLDAANVNKIVVETQRIINFLKSRGILE